MEYMSRKDIRLKEYDYSSNGMYFLTICAKGRAEIFSKIENGDIILTETGRIVQSEWKRISDTEKGVETLDFCVMPNHIHGVLLFTETGVVLGEIIRRFKARVTREAGHPVWQRNYYEHVIRSDAEYQKIAEYIAGNPSNWMEDEENSARRKRL